jgi:hypothetical protein
VHLFQFFLLGLFLSSCSTHTVNFRDSHFATPIAGEKQWSGSIAGVASAVTRVTIVDNITTNPPTKTTVKINEFDASNELNFTNYLDIDLSLSLLGSLDIIWEKPLVGLKWQLINNDSNPNEWVAAILAGYGDRSVTTIDSSSTSTNPIDATSVVKSNLAGMSIGYRFGAGFVPYVSYTEEQHNTSTTVNNSSGEFGPYDAIGKHKTTSFGFCSGGSKFFWAVEHNTTNISWAYTTANSTTALPTTDTQQFSVGARFGFAW